MPKQPADDLTVAHNTKVLAAIKTIGQGLMALADALVAPGASANQPEPRPAAARSPKEEAPPSAEEEQPADDEEGEQEEIKLADLQKMAKDLIKAGGRPKLLEILESHELENVSSAPETLWATLKKELEVASE